MSTSNNNGVNNALIVDTDNMHHNDEEYELQPIENTTSDETDSEENSEESDDNNENDNILMRGANNEEYRFEPQDDTEDDEMECDLDEECRVETTIFIILASWFGFAMGTLIGHVIRTTSL
jgi:hypothetical protein